MENPKQEDQPDGTASASPSSPAVPPAASSSSSEPTLAVEKAELPPFIKEIEPSMWKAAFGFGFALLGIAFVVNAVILLLTGLFTSWDLWGPMEALTGGPFALLVLSIFGSLSSNVDFFVDSPLTLRFVPLLSTLSLLIGATVLANRIGGGERPGHVGAGIVLSVAPALAIAGVTTIVAAIFRVELEVIDVALELSAASVGNFFWLALVFSVLIFVTKMGPANNWLNVYGGKGLDWIGRSSLAGGLFFVGFSGVVVAIVSVFTDLDVIPWDLALPLAGVVVSAGAALVALSQVGLAAGFFGSEIGVFADTFTALEIVGIVVILAISLLLSAALILLRRGGRLGETSFWIRTPIAFAIIGILVTWLSSVQLSGLSQTLNIGAVGWTFAIFVVWGVVVEILTRYTGAYVVKVVPAGLRTRLMPSADPAS